MRLLLLHGFTGRGCSWDATIRHLQSRLGSAATIEAPDLPGHGRANSRPGLPDSISPSPHDSEVGTGLAPARRGEAEDLVQTPRAWHLGDAESSKHRVTAAKPRAGASPAPTPEGETSSPTLDRLGGDSHRGPEDVPEGEISSLFGQRFRDVTESPDRELPANFAATVELLAESYLSHHEPTHMIGYSLGGRLALALALHAPDSVASLTLIGARAGLGADQRRLRAEADREQAREVGANFHAFLDRWQDLPLFASQRRLPPEILRAQRRLREGQDPAGMAWALAALSPGLMPDFRDRLAALPMPVRLVVGELDLPYLEIAEQMHRRLADSTLHRVPGVGHNIPLEAPERLAELIASHLGTEIEANITAETLP